MTKEFFETERLILKPFSILNEEEKKIVGDSWANPFNARYNAMRDPYGSVEELANLPEPTFSDFNNYYDCMFFRVAFSKENGEIVGTCRFGKYHTCENADVWDFGDNVLLKVTVRKLFLKYVILQKRGVHYEYEEAQTRKIMALIKQ